MSIRKQIEATVEGRVQGVGFRASTVRVAKRLSCTGWVRNNTNGTVTCVAQGDDDQLQQMIDFLEDGPPTARVTSVNVDWQGVSDVFEDFSIRH